MSFPPIELNNPMSIELAQANREYNEALKLLYERCMEEVRRIDIKYECIFDSIAEKYAGQ